MRLWGNTLSVTRVWLGATSVLSNQLARGVTRSFQPFCSQCLQQPLLGLADTTKDIYPWHCCLLSWVSNKIHCMPFLWLVKILLYLFRGWAVFPNSPMHKMLHSDPSPPHQSHKLKKCQKCSENVPKKKSWARWTSTSSWRPFRLCDPRPHPSDKHASTYPH